MIHDGLLGKIVLYHGSMFSHKSESLITTLDDYKRIGFGVVAFKHCVDNRYGPTDICSHSGHRFPAKTASNARDISDYVEQWQHVKVVGIDELQFFDDGIIQLAEDFRDQGRIVVASGLLETFLNEPFPLNFGNGKKTMYDFFAVVDYAIKQYGLCTYRNEESMVCGASATRTQRLYADGTPVPFDDPLIAVGNDKADEKTAQARKYEARCSRHHLVAYDGRILPLHKFRKLQAASES